MRWVVYSILPILSLRIVIIQLSNIFLKFLFVWLLVNRDKYNAILVAGCRVTGILGVVAVALLQKPCLLRPAVTGEISGTVFLDHSLVTRVRVLQPEIELIFQLRNKFFARAVSALMATSPSVEDELLRQGSPLTRSFKSRMESLPVSLLLPLPICIGRSLKGRT